MLSSAIVLITLALVFYTMGVWAERRHGTLTWLHVVFFALGLTFDVSGTWVMGRIAATQGLQTAGTAGVLNQIMAVTGALALAIMAIHLVWAIAVVIRDRANERAAFHKFSVAVWAFWLIPYFTGMIGSMAG